MAKSKGDRIFINLACTECRERTYHSQKNRRNDPGPHGTQEVLPALQSTPGPPRGSVTYHGSFTATQSCTRRTEQAKQRQQRQQRRRQRRRCHGRGCTTTTAVTADIRFSVRFASRATPNPKPVWVPQEASASVHRRHLLGAEEGHLAKLRGNALPHFCGRRRCDRHGHPARIGRPAVRLDH